VIPHTRRLATLFIAAILLAACSGDGGSSTSSSPDTVPQETTAAESTTTAASTTTSTTLPAPTYAATIDELLSIGRPIVLAHTAGEDEFPASTLFAFGESVKAGVDMLDLNVNITKDDELVVQHDDSVDRNTNGTGAVNELTMAEIATLDGAYWFTQACADCHDRGPAEYLYRGMRTGEKAPPKGYTADDFALPTLRQLVERYPDIPLNIEIKGEGDIAKHTADVLAAQLKELGREDATVVASFQDDIVSYFHSIAPGVEVSPGLNVLTAYVLNSTPIPDGMRILQLPPEFSGLKVITPELVARATADGNPIWVWPNNRALENQASYEDFLAQGIVGLNINFPAQGVAAVAAYMEATSVEAAASAGCDNESPAAPGQYDGTFAEGGLDGTVSTYLPATYDGATPLPLVLGLHGWLETPAVFAAESDLPARGERYGFVTVVPDITRTVAHWDTALDGADVKWIAALLDQVETSNCIDTNRVYVTGMSNGAMMTSSLSCVLADRIAAAAPVAGVTDPPGCSRTEPVPVVAFHGTADPYLSYNGGLGDKALALPGPDGTGTVGDLAADDPAGLAVGLSAPVLDRVANWNGRNGCDGGPSDTDPTSDVVVSDWVGCEVGATRLYTINGGGHTWPGSAFDTAIADLVGPTTTTIDATNIIWQFFVMHPKAN
jgi:poly(3-hydroxybutyrate) depolymerase/glycerophosphoryl diester phosphodiesterase